MDEKTQRNLRRVKSSFWSFFIKKRPVAWLVALAIIIGGVFSYQAMPREIQPEIKIPFAAVVTALPGANPTDVESLLTIPLEEKIADVSDVKLMSSTSGFGFSSIFVEFDAKVDMDDKLQELKDAVDLAKSELPSDATDPVAAKAEANSFSIITFSLLSDSRPLVELTEIAEDVQNELEKVSNVSTVQIGGSQNKLIEVEVNQTKLEGYGITLQTVADLIKYSNNNLPIGIVSSDKINYSIRIDNRYETLEDIRNLPLFTIGQENKTQIFLKDIAKVEETLPPQNVINKLSINGQEALPTISLQVYNKDDTNIIQVADDANAKVEELKESGEIPSDVEIIVTNDNSVFIEKELGTLTKNGVQTAIVITIILFLALGLRQGIIAGLSIPLIFCFAFIIMRWQGMTINTLSLFSLVIALGLIVDTTIVIMEGIHENIRKGLSPRDSALLSVQTYKWPLMAGTFTTVFAFFPMLLVSGILGQFLRTMPITISAALLGSIFIALTIAPSISTKFVKSRKADKKGSILEPIFDYLGKKFQKIMRFIVQSASMKFIIIMITLGAFALSMSLPITGALKVEMFPVTNQTYFVVQIETEKGTVLSETEKIALEVQEYLYEVPEVDNFLTKVGTNVSVGITEDADFMGGGTSDSNLANITVNLIDIDEREKASYEIAQEVREHYNTYRNAKISIIELAEGPPSEGAITIRVTGQNMETLQDLAAEIQKITENTPGTANVELSLKPGLNEFKFELDKDILAFHGLSGIQVSAQIRTIIQGIDSTNITIDDEDLDILVKYDLPEKEGKTNISIHEIENFQIPTPAGYTVSLGEIGSYEFGPSLSSIAREDEKRIIKVTGDTETDADITTITADIQEEIDNLDLPNGYEVKFGGDLEEINKSFQELFQSMFVAAILIAFTLVLMFNSFKQPLIIMLTLPLALIGVFPGLMSIGLKLSFPAFLGVVALTGIVVNDAIVLIDRINTNRRRGMEFANSIAEAAEARLQPIVMTSITTIAGILPLALTDEFWTGLGFSLIFGLAASTVLTLVVIPVLYYIFEVRADRKKEAARLNA
jgi:hydrophobic/amphiphilic exporter-1 (mainly G- bacteria), HAE1 family